MGGLPMAHLSGSRTNSIEGFCFTSQFPQVSSFVGWFLGMVSAELCLCWDNPLCFRASWWLGTGVLIMLDICLAGPHLFSAVRALQAINFRSV